MRKMLEELSASASGASAVVTTRLKISRKFQRKIYLLQI